MGFPELVACGALWFRPCGIQHAGGLSRVAPFELSNPSSLEGFGLGFWFGTLETLVWFSFCNIVVAFKSAVLITLRTKSTSSAWIGVLSP